MKYKRRYIPISISSNAIIFLRQQIKVLQDELGYDGPDKEVEKLRKRAESKKWPKAVADHFNKELDKLLRINPMAAEYPVAMNYVEFMLDLPWGEYTVDDFDLKRAKKILDQDHFGLDKSKDPNTWNTWQCSN